MPQVTYTFTEIRGRRYLVVPFEEAMAANKNGVDISPLSVIVDNRVYLDEFRDAPAFALAAKLRLGDVELTREDINIREYPSFSRQPIN